MINMINGRFLLAKTSSYTFSSLHRHICSDYDFDFIFSFAPLNHLVRYVVYLLFGAWWFANMCSDANVSFPAAFFVFQLSW